jgi:two-component system C4-dicarboxylate transport response regulator DctD
MLPGEESQNGRSLSQQVDCFERSLIEHALVSANGSIKDVMEDLAIPRKTLYDKMRKYGLKKSDYK